MTSAGIGYGAMGARVDVRHRVLGEDVRMRSRTRARTSAVALVLAMLLNQLMPALAWAAPSAPVISAPTDGAAVTAARPTLTWQPSAGATTYVAEYATAHNFAQNLTSSGSIADTSFTPTSD